MGSFRDASIGFEQARFHIVGGGAISTISTTPFNPTLLFLAAALWQVNQKLDTIQEMQREMVEYLRQRDKAELRGDLQTLLDIMGDYSFNVTNEMWCKNAHMKVMDIKQEMEKASVHLRAQIRGELDKRLFAETRAQVRSRLEEICNRMREYRSCHDCWCRARFSRVAAGCPRNRESPGMPSF